VRDLVVAADDGTDGGAAWAVPLSAGGVATVAVGGAIVRRRRHRASSPLPTLEP
jgi:hypothetical protein